MRDRLLWLTSLLFVAWLVWSETSFQFYEQSLGRDLGLSVSRVSLIAGSFLVPYGLLQIPVGRFLDQGRLDRWLWMAALLASGFSVAFAFSHDLPGLMLSRMGMGMACAVAFPASALIARKTLPAKRFPLAMGLTDSLLGWGAAFAAFVPLVLPSAAWRHLVIVQALLLAVLVVVPVIVLTQGRTVLVCAPDRHRSQSAVPWTPTAVGQVIRACLIYAWGGGFVFGLAQYGLISGLRGWSGERMQWMSLTMSLGIALGMVLSGYLGSCALRRGRVLLTGTVLNGLALLALLQLPNHATGPLGVSALCLGLGLGAAVLAFPLAEEGAPQGHTAFTVAIVNTTGTVMGGVMAIVSGLILQASAPGDVMPVLMVYGLLALFGVAIALGLVFRPSVVQDLS